MSELRATFSPVTGLREIKNQAFTILESLVVMVIIALLSTILLGAYLKKERGGDDLPKPKPVENETPPVQPEGTPAGISTPPATTPAPQPESVAGN